MTSRLNRTTLGRFAKFATAGGLSFLANLALLWLGTALLKLHYVFSMLVSALTVNVIGFTINRYWTFDATSNPLLGDARRYLLANAVTMLAALAGTAFLVEVLRVQYLLANALVAAVLLCGNFAVHSSWTFRAR
jgi:putative flippase GtrA